MQVQNPDYQYYKKLAGTWKNAEGTCEIALTETVGITVSYGGAVLSGSYGVFPVDPSVWGGQPHLLPADRMGMMGMMGQDMVFHCGEDIKIRLGDKALKNGDQIIFNINGLWHEVEDKLHLELTDTSAGKRYDFILFREGSGAAPGLKEGEALCQCGQIFSGRFCPNCGSPKNP